MVKDFCRSRPVRSPYFSWDKFTCEFLEKFEWRYDRPIGQRLHGHEGDNNMYGRGKDPCGYSWRVLDNDGCLVPSAPLLRLSYFLRLHLMQGSWAP